MFPNRHPNPVPPPQPTSNHHAKEVISELCDRIKSEYTSMYSHIQSLKGELDKVSNQRADFERYYSLNQDMSYIFSTEIHKMMDVIKRLVQACMQQVPFLPPDLQNSCVHLIEQVKHYTVNEPPMSFMQHGPPPPMHGPPQPPHIGPPSHNSHMNSTPHGGPPHMMPPHMHQGGPHMGPHHPMMPGYPGRMPSMPGPMHHYNSESREMGHLQSNEMYRYSYKEKEVPPGPPLIETCNGTSTKERKTLSSAKVNSVPQPQNVSGKQNGNEKADSAGIHKEVQENDAGSEKLEETNNVEIASNEEDCVNKSPTEIVTSSNKIPSVSDSHLASKKSSESDSTSGKTCSMSPTRRREVVPGVHPYERPAPSVSSISRHSTHGANTTNIGSAKIAPTPFIGAIPRQNTNGSSYPNMPHGYPPPFPEPCHYPMGAPPYGRHPHMHPPFDPMMMPRNNAHIPPPYGQPMHPYQMPSPLPPNSYTSYIGGTVKKNSILFDYQDNSYASGNGNNVGPKVPKSFSAVSSLQHADVVCAVSFSSPFNYIFTGCKGMVKIWDVADVASPKLLSSIDCLKENYVRACKSINENKLLIVAGEYPSVGIWSLTPNNNGGLSVNTVCELANPAPVCYNMAITSDEKQCYCCCGNGVIVGWDIETARIIRSYTGHVDGATSIDISPDGSSIWTGGLDATARCWDARDGKQSHAFSFPTQVFSLCIAPTSDYIVVGLENKTAELCYLKESGNRFGERHVFKVHDSCVLTVKIASSGKWMVSSSKDNYTNCVKLPQGSPIFITRETASIICTEISPDDKYVITGGGEKKATIYECIYP